MGPSPSRDQVSHPDAPTYSPPAAALDEDEKIAREKFGHPLHTLAIDAPPLAHLRRVACHLSEREKVLDDRC